MKKDRLKEIIKESFVTTLNEIGKEDPDFSLGVKSAARHRSANKRLDDDHLSLYSPSFQKGYNYVMKGSGWQRFNDKLSDFLGKLGYSRTRGL